MGNEPAAAPDGHKGIQHLGSIQEPLCKGFLQFEYKILPKCDFRHLCPFQGLICPKPKNLYSHCAQVDTHTINLLQIVSNLLMILAQFGRGVKLSKRFCLLEVLWTWLEERDIISSLDEGKTLTSESPDCHCSGHLGSCNYCPFQTHLTRHSSEGQDRRREQQHCMLMKLGNNNCFIYKHPPPLLNRSGLCTTTTKTIAH